MFLHDIKRLMQKRLHDLHPITGMCDVLNTLHQQNIPMALLTSNAMHNVIPFLERFNINFFEWFDCDISLFNKTHHLKSQIKKRNLKEYNCLYIGDEIRDIKAAKESGIKVISVSWGLQPSSLLQKHHPDYFINTPNELIDLITSF
jgi:phosphoglycolate phosphatase